MKIARSSNDGRKDVTFWSVVDDAGRYAGKLVAVHQVVRTNWRTGKCKHLFSITDSVSLTVEYRRSRRTARTHAKNVLRGMIQ